ncbi:MAG: phosphopantetheine-binding protein [Acidobacteriota bacterium]
MADTILQVKQLIIDSLNLEGMTPDMIGDDDVLFGEGLGLDSVDALELVVAMEKAYGIKIRSDEMDPEAFASCRRLADFVEERKAAAGAAPA